MLLLTDRLKDGRRLWQLMETIEPCTLVGPGQTAASSPDHALIVCDAGLDDAAAVAALRSIVAYHRVDLGVPLLYLARGQGADTMAQAEAIGANAVLPRDASDAQILFTVKQMLGSGRSAARRCAAPPDPAVQASVREAATAFGEVFEGARRGRPITADSLEQGANAVMAAAGGGRIGAWLDVVRNYDDITYQHCLLVAGLSAGFAARLGVTLKGQRLIAQGALVHDIGKAGIPQALLNKPGALSPAEMDIMRAHPQIGYDMLVRQGGFDPQLLDIVRHHHEYIDGTGYPDALAGDKVSTPTRLVTICDIYAALIERRSYKAPTPPREAWGILVRMGGKLDVGLLRAFHGLVGTP